MQSLPRPDSSSHPPHASRSILQLHQRIIRRLGLEIAIKEQRIITGAPRVRIADAPDSDAHALGLLQAAFDGVDVVSGASLCDVELGDGDFLYAGGGEGFDRCGDGCTAADAQVGLCSYKGDGQCWGS